MSLIATLQLEDNSEMKVLNCDWRFTQMTDSIGKPVAIAKGGLINVTLEADGSSYLFAWMIDPTMRKSGVFTLFNADSISENKKIEFEDAFCVSYFETFDSSGFTPRQIHLSISAREFAMGNVRHINNWPAFEKSGNEQEVEGE